MNSNGRLQEVVAMDVLAGGAGPRGASGRGSRGGGRSSGRGRTLLFVIGVALLFALVGCSDKLL